MRVPQNGYRIGLPGVGLEDNMVSAMFEWPEPDTVKGLQRFLGFGNFYRRFICRYSSVVAPLTDLWGKPKRITFTPKANSAFAWLKHLYHYTNPEVT